MKLFEMKISRDGLTIRREAEERLTGNQKFYIIMALIVAATLIAALCFIGWKALIGALGALLMFGIYKLFENA